MVKSGKSRGEAQNGDVKARLMPFSLDNKNFWIHSDEDKERRELLEQRIDHRVNYQRHNCTT